MALPRRAEVDGGREVMRNPGQLAADGTWLVITESTGEGPYKHSCGTEILGETVAHPIWDGPFPCSGSGRCSYEQVPYCPTCENKPSFHGTSISKETVK